MVVEANLILVKVFSHVVAVCHLWNLVCKNTFICFSDLLYVHSFNIFFFFCCRMFMYIFLGGLVVLMLFGMYQVLETRTVSSSAVLFLTLCVFTSIFSEGGIRHCLCFTNLKVVSLPVFCRKRDSQ